MAKTSDKILKTTDYGMFKTKKGNRGVSRGHVNRLIISLKENNLLASNPIIVNLKDEVIDGQHRLAAAKELNMPIYYVYFDPASLNEIQLLNSNTKLWTAIDFLNSYIALNKPQYKKFKELYELWGYNFSPTVLILASPDGKKGKSLSRAFKNGEFEIQDLEKSQEIVDAIDSVLKYSHASVRHSNPFYYAIMKIYHQDPKIVMALSEKIQAGSRLYRMGNITEYFRQFEEILNKGNYGKPIRLY